MSFTAQDVKKLRDATGAGMMDCKKALNESGGDYDGAVKWLREKGIAAAAKRADREASEGSITSYIHLGGKVGVLIEVNCETDFVAKTDDFQQLCADLCLQICAATPTWVRQEDVPQSAIDGEMAIYTKQAEDTGKPANIAEKIAQGKLKKWFKQVCLLEQEFVRDPDQTVDDLVKGLSGKVGEKIGIRRFTRYQLGEGVDASAGEPSGDGS
jgi:elongation factor Ts